MGGTQHSIVLVPATAVALCGIFIAGNVFTPAAAAPITLQYTTSLAHPFGGIPYNDTGIPGQSPASGTLPSFFAPLSLLHPALAPLLQQVEIAVSASTVDRVSLTNSAPVDRTLTYSLNDTLTMQLNDPLRPSIGPVVGATTNYSNSVAVPFNFSLSATPVAGSSLSSTTSFTGAQAQQFVGDGTFALEFFSAVTFGVTGSPDEATYRENGIAFNDLSGTATVSYTLDLPVTPLALTFNVPLAHPFGGIPFNDTGIPGQSPASGTSPSFFAPLSLLNPALAPLLQQVEIAVTASSVNRVSLTNSAPVDRTLTYSLNDTLTMQLNDPLRPSIGPVVGATTNYSNSVAVPFNFSLFAPPVAGSSLSSTTSFTGAQAQQFVGDGAFALEFFSAMTFGVTGSPDEATYRENGIGFNDLSGTASVTYYLAARSAEMPAPGTLALVGLGALVASAVRRRGARRGISPG